MNGPDDLVTQEPCLPEPVVELIAEEVPVVELTEEEIREREEEGEVVPFEIVQEEVVPFEIVEEDDLEAALAANAAANDQDNSQGMSW